MIAVAVHGAEGRMGRLVSDLIDQADGFELVGLIGEPGRDFPAGEFHPRLPLTGQDRMAEVLPTGCVVVDFSLASALDLLLARCATLEAGLVSGTTGYSAAQTDALRAHAERYPVVHATNFSIGIPALQMLVQLLGRTLPAGFNAELVETHHTAKIDRPSGTAATLAEAFVRSREGVDEVPIHSQRLGGVIGEHTWTFSDQEETLVLTHRAHSRRAFLRGILPAVRFVDGRSHGLFDLMDVLKKIL